MKKVVVMLSGVLLALSSSVFAVYNVSGPTNGWADLGDLTKEWEARAKGQNSGWEIAAGTNVAAPGQNDNEQVNPWGDQPYNFVFTLTGNTIKLDFPDMQEMVAYSGINPVSDLFLQVRAADNYSLTAADLMIDSQALPTLDINSGVEYLHISGITGDFTLTGQLRGDLDAGSNINERVKFDIIGASGTPIIPAPGAIVLGMIGTGMVARYRRNFSK